MREALEVIAEGLCKAGFLDITITHDGPSRKTAEFRSKSGIVTVTFDEKDRT